MPVLNQFIYKLRLDSRLDYILFFCGFLAKIFTIIIFSSVVTDDLFFPFVSYYAESNFDNPYKFFSDETLEPFPYPLGMLYVLSLLIFLLKTIFFHILTLVITIIQSSKPRFTLWYIMFIRNMIPNS